MTFVPIQTEADALMHVLNRDSLFPDASRTTTHAAPDSNHGNYSNVRGGRIKKDEHTDR